MKPFTFISIPRTASNSIHQALGTKHKDNHKSIRCIDAEGFTFAVIRNPFDRLVSWYVYHRSTVGDPYKVPFKKWIKQGCPHHWQPNLLKSLCITNPLNQHEYVDDTVSLARFENLKMEWKSICKELDIDFDLPHTYRTKRKNWYKYFDAETLDIVKQQFKEDFLLYSK